MEGKQWFFYCSRMEFEYLLKEKEENFANGRCYCVPLLNLCGSMVL